MYYILICELQHYPKCLTTGGEVGLVIPPTLVIEHQMERQMAFWGTTFLNLSKVRTEYISSMIQREKPSILLSNIERLENPEVQASLLTLRLSYVAVDEAQVV